MCFFIFCYLIFVYGQFPRAGCSADNFESWVDRQARAQEVYPVNYCQLITFLCCAFRASKLVIMKNLKFHQTVLKQVHFYAKEKINCVQLVFIYFQILQLEWAEKQNILFLSLNPFLIAPTTPHSPVLQIYAYIPQIPVVCPNYIFKYFEICLLFQCGVLLHFALTCYSFKISRSLQNHYNMTKLRFLKNSSNQLQPTTKVQRPPPSALQHEGIDYFNQCLIYFEANLASGCVLIFHTRFLCAITPWYFSIFSKFLIKY